MSSMPADSEPASAHKSNSPSGLPYSSITTAALMLGFSAIFASASALSFSFGSGNVAMIAVFAGFFAAVGLLTFVALLDSLRLFMLRTP